MYAHIKNCIQGGGGGGGAKMAKMLRTYYMDAPCCFLFLISPVVHMHLNFSPNTGTEVVLNPISILS